MEVITTAAEMRKWTKARKAEGLTMGLVPTMGYFHEGHLSLMRKSAEECGRTIVSLFVNPTQFGPSEDLEKYPRDMERDSRMAREAGVDVIFFPDIREMYPSGFRTYVRVEEWGDRLCGVTRPIHFRGVTTICCKLFNICAPDKAYFGLKDAQQYLVISKMAADLNMDLEVVPMPTVREADGLAMSSRNVYLSTDERLDAVRISKSLGMARDKAAAGETDAEAIKEFIRGYISGSPLARVDYVEAVDTVTLESVKSIRPGTLIAAAVFFGETRLIDNVII